MSEVLLRAPKPGDYGWIIHRQSLLCVNERSWIAEIDGQIVGSVFLVSAGREEGEAKLRMLYVEPACQGQGVSRKLVRECIAFARQAGYKKITLWTNSILHAARRIYETEGFKLIKSEPHFSFGQNLIGETWELVIHTAAP